MEYMNDDKCIVLVRKYMYFYHVHTLYVMHAVHTRSILLLCIRHMYLCCSNLANFSKIDNYDLQSYIQYLEQQLGH